MNEGFIDKIMNEHADNLQRFTERILKQYEPALKGIEKDLFNDLIVLLSSFNFTDATDLDVANIVAAIDKLYVQAINKPEFVNDTRKFLQNFDEVRKNALELHKEVSNLSYTPQFYEMLNKQQRFLVDKTLYELQQGGLKKYFVEDAKQVLLEAANLGYSQKQIEKRLRQRLLSQPDKDSYYVRYATQVSRDSVNQYNGQVNQMVQDEYDLDMIRYVGSVVGDSRPFCVHVRKELKGKIKRSELPALLAKYSGSSGMIQNTNANNFYVVRGGWNCRHEAIPYRSTSAN
jgi:hypothetical protein